MFTFVFLRFLFHINMAHSRFNVSAFLHYHVCPTSLHRTIQSPSSLPQFHRHPRFHYHHTFALPFTVVMNVYQNGTRVFYWDVRGNIVYGTVESTSRMTDGTQVVGIRVDELTCTYRLLVEEVDSLGGEWVEIFSGIVSLPISCVSKIT